jgi:hypothetical protein
MSVEVAGGLEKLKTNHRPRVGRGDEIARGVPDREIGRLGEGGAWGGVGGLGVGRLAELCRMAARRYDLRELMTPFFPRRMIHVGPGP